MGLQQKGVTPGNNRKALKAGVLQYANGNSINITGHFCRGNSIS
jgi:hypothetical protein